MPEGHTILRAANLWNTLAGTPLAVSSPQGRFAKEASSLNGLSLLKAEARGKHLFLYFPNDQIVHIHLGLYGKHHWRPAPAPMPTATVRLRVEHPTGVIDLNGPNTCELLNSAEAELIFNRLGPDPLKDEKLPDKFIKRMESVKMSVGRLLMEQNQMAGIGNVYRAEVLFICGISPYTPAKDISKATWKKLWAVTRELMLHGVNHPRGIETIYSGSPLPVTLPAGAALTLDRSTYVYKRTDRPCFACGTIVEQEAFYGRTLYLCRVCQPAIAPAV